jgi:hypothetical protein
VKGNCENQNEITQRKLPNYFYTGDQRRVQFDANMYYLPRACEDQFSYSCSVSSGPRTDICNIILGTEGPGTEASFDTETGKYSLSTTDIVGVPPGVYVFDITGTLGTKSHTTQYTVELKNPCLTSRPKFRQSPFSDKTLNLRDEDLEQAFSIDQVGYRDIAADCGPIKVEFAHKNGDALDPLLWKDARDVYPGSIAPHTFSILYTEDTRNAQVYEIYYFLSYESYPSSQVRSPQPIKYTVLNPCHAPVSITPTNFDDQEWTITTRLIDNVYNWDAFTIDPDWCRIKYSFDTDAEDPVIKDNLRETIHLNGWK